jgi:diacylglycerol kinase (ATP)
MTAQELERLIRDSNDAVLIVNTRARRRLHTVTRLQRALAQRGIQVSEAIAVTDPATLPAVVRAAISHHLVIVGGGDGTISAAVDELAYQDGVLGVLPLGTENAMARSLGIPLRLASALDTIATGHVTEIDLACINGDYYANVAALGITATAVHDTSWRLKVLLGKLAYVLVGLGHLANHRPFTCQLVTDGGRQEFRTHQLIIANGPYFGDLPLTDRTALTNRQLTICRILPLGRWRLLWRWAIMLLTHRPLPDTVQCLLATELWLDTFPPQLIDVDGEATLSTPAHFSVAPHALKVLVPAQA